jgi:hypothetical protein
MRSKIFPYKFFLKFFVRIEKRKRFIIATLLLTFLVLALSFLSFSRLKYSLVILALIVYFLTYFCILEGIEKIEWLMLFILPVYFTVTYLVFYFLLPVRWLTRLPFIFLYAISIYAILLSSNIFNVGVEKSLQLFRAAFSVNFLFSTLTSFLIFNLILSFKLNFFFNFVSIFVFIFPLLAQFLWSINPKTYFAKDLVKYTFLISLLLGELGLVFSFIPARSNILALFLTTSFYCLGGLFQAFLEEKLFKERIREYLAVLVIIFIITMLASSW